MKILIIEDDSAIVEVISIALRIRWPEVQLYATGNGEKGLELIESELPNLVLLDLGLPDMDGFEVLRQARTYFALPIVILTVRSEESDIIKGLEWGADEYVVKPFRQLELVSRINAVLRRRHIDANEPALIYGSLRFDYFTRRLHDGKKEMSLTPSESQILYHLMINSEKVVTCRSLSEALWGDDFPNASDAIRVYIRRLREKIEPNPSHPELIHTQSGVGYILKELSQ